MEKSFEETDETYNSDRVIITFDTSTDIPQEEKMIETKCIFDKEIKDKIIIVEAGNRTRVSEMTEQKIPSSHIDPNEFKCQKMGKQGNFLAKLVNSENQKCSNLSCFMLRKENHRMNAYVLSNNCTIQKFNPPFYDVIATFDLKSKQCFNLQMSNKGIFYYDHQNYIIHHFQLPSCKISQVVKIHVNRYSDDTFGKLGLEIKKIFHYHDDKLIYITPFLSSGAICKDPNAKPDKLNFFLTAFDISKRKFMVYQDNRIGTDVVDFCVNGEYIYTLDNKARTVSKYKFLSNSYPLYMKTMNIVSKKTHSHSCKGDSFLAIASISSLIFTACKHGIQVNSQSSHNLRGECIEEDMIDQISHLMITSSEAKKVTFMIALFKNEKKRFTIFNINMNLNLGQKAVLTRIYQCKKGNYEFPIQTSEGVISMMMFNTDLLIFTKYANSYNNNQLKYTLIGKIILNK